MNYSASISDTITRLVCKRTKRRGYALDGKHISLLLNISTENSGQRKCSLVIPAWGVAAKMRNTISQGRCNYRTLGKTLGTRH